MADEKEILRYQLDISDVEAKAARIQQLVADIARTQAGGGNTAELEATLGREVVGLANFARESNRAGGAAGELIRNKQKLAAVVAMTGGEFGGLVSRLGTVVTLLLSMGPAVAGVAAGLAGLSIAQGVWRGIAEEAERARKAAEDYRTALDRINAERGQAVGGMTDILASAGLATGPTVRAAQQMARELEGMGFDPQRAAQIAAKGIVGGARTARESATGYYAQLGGWDVGQPGALRAFLERGPVEAVMAAEAQVDAAAGIEAGRVPPALRVQEMLARRGEAISTTEIEQRAARARELAARRRRAQEAMAAIEAGRETEEHRRAAVELDIAEGTGQLLSLLGPTERARMWQRAAERWAREQATVQPYATMLESAEQAYAQAGAAALPSDEELRAAEQRRRAAEAWSQARRGRGVGAGAVPRSARDALRVLDQRRAVTGAPGPVGRETSVAGGAGAVGEVGAPGGAGAAAAAAEVGVAPATDAEIDELLLHVALIIGGMHSAEYNAQRGDTAKQIFYENDVARTRQRYPAAARLVDLADKRQRELLYRAHAIRFWERDAQKARAEGDTRGAAWADEMVARQLRDDPSARPAADDPAGFIGALQRQHNVTIINIGTQFNAGDQRRSPHRNNGRLGVYSGASLRGGDL